MIRKISTKKLISSGTGLKPPNLLMTDDWARGRMSFSTVLSDDLHRQGIPAANGQDVNGESPAKKLDPKPAVDMLARFFSFLRGRGSTPKQLRLLETLPLGEKRFVALVSAEGHKFLIGGGSSGVSLLTRLDETPTPDNVAAESVRSIPAASRVPEIPENIERPKSFVELAGIVE